MARPLGTHKVTLPLTKIDLDKGFWVMIVAWVPTMFEHVVLQLRHTRTSEDGAPEVLCERVLSGDVALAIIAALEAGGVDTACTMARDELLREFPDVRTMGIGNPRNPGEINVRDR
jgi:hypothetical protein